MGKKDLEKIKSWIKRHPGLFQTREDAGSFRIRELYSGKEMAIMDSMLEQVAEKTNRLDPSQSYLILLLSRGRQLVLSPQGLAFPPDFTNTGPMSLPSQVYCMRDFHHLFDKLRHLAAEEDRQKEATELLMMLIALLDGASALGLDVVPETRQVEAILTQLEKNQTPPSPHSGEKNP